MGSLCPSWSWHCMAFVVFWTLLFIIFRSLFALISLIGLSAGRADISRSHGAGKLFPEVMTPSKPEISTDIRQPFSRSASRSSLVPEDNFGQFQCRYYLVGSFL